MLRCRTTAAADDGNTVVHEGSETCTEVVRCALIEGTPVDDNGMTRVRHEGDRQGTRTKEMHKFLHRTDTTDAVEADCINVAALRDLAYQFLNKETVTRIASGESGERGQNKRIGCDLFDVRRRLNQPLGG